MSVEMQKGRRPISADGLVRCAMEGVDEGRMDGVALVILPAGGGDAMHVHVLPADAKRRRALRNGVMELLAAVHGGGRSGGAAHGRE